jgi:hypothetical protein
MHSGETGSGSFGWRFGFGTYGVPGRANFRHSARLLNQRYW